MELKTMGKKSLTDSADYGTCPDIVLLLQTGNLIVQEINTYHCCDSRKLTYNLLIVEFYEIL